MDKLKKINELQYEINNLNDAIEENKIIHHERDALQQDNKKLQKNNEELKNFSLININRSTTIFILSALLLLIIIILFLSLIIIRQRKWRREYYNENSSKFIGQLPERIAETIDRSEEAYNNLEEKNHKQYDSFNQNLHQVAKLLEQISKKNQENVSKTNEQISAFRKFSNEKNELVKKYQEFYDFSILKSYILETISAIDDLEDSVRDLENKNHPQESIEAVNFAKLKLITILENDNINQVQPNLEITFWNRF